jgi:hypothetical protein
MPRSFISRRRAALQRGLRFRLESNVFHLEANQPPTPYNFSAPMSLCQAHATLVTFGTRFEPSIFNRILYSFCK